MKIIKKYKVQIERVFRYRRMRYEWRWKVVATNGRIIGSSTESYVNFKDCEYNIQSLGESLINYEETIRY